MWDMEGEARVTAGCACERLEALATRLSRSRGESTASSHPSDPLHHPLECAPLICEEGRLSRCSTHSEGDDT